ncbi:MBL fold metallo-hydrolase [Tenacibaculum mesophilum]|uniref:MBL fold metallo-hydrolase n=1 Tax=Tenacibaculum mesophilum TaxID=104268 RepID=UPI00249209BA|nr:MBL fold metallo-hydrolase [Tenacibaculum mesophilum]
MEVFFYQAECGDSARIRFYDKKGIPRNILIDSGYERTFNFVLKDEIKKIIESNERLDICVISHIHDDHIGGLVKYIKIISSEELIDVIDKWFYNLPRDYENIKRNQITISSPKSISQGDEIYKYINLNRKDHINDLTNHSPLIEFFDFKIDILSPSQDKLASLREKYKQTEVLLERIELDSISEAKSIRNHDYSIKIEDFDLDDWKEDESKENGSSISMITEYKKNKILWLADSHPSVVVESLKKRGYTKNNKLCCDWVKVSHHGSSGNNSNELYELIECDNYLISANGENRHKLPTKICITKILLNKNRNSKKKMKFYFTYDNDTLTSIFKVDGEDVFERYNFEVHYNSNKFLKIGLK